jgi:polysaccharide export outer membrane protein
MNRKQLLIGFGALSLAFSSLAHAQQRVDRSVNAPAAPPAGQQPDVDGSKLYGGYMIGVGDIIAIRIAEEEDVSGRYQVSESGDVKIPLLEKPIHADGLSTFDFSSKLADELKKQQILKDPYVTVFIERGMTENVTVSGQVVRPGIYPIERPTKLLDVISMSGGLTPGAGQTITITHPTADQKSSAAAGSNGGAEQKLVSTGDADGKTAQGADANAAKDAVITNVDVATLMSGTDHGANVLVHAGDQINVGNASVVYVVGSVTKPGAFSVQDPRNGISVLKALALVEGTTSTAALSKAIIVRNSTDEAGRQEIPLDLAKIMKGQVKDPVLGANDILYVPNSAFRQGMKRAGDAMTLAAGYGLGLRIAP